MDFRVGSSVSRFREAAAVSDQDLIPGTTENNNKDNSKNPS
jgi:hypothetical protein